jgi:hypothetical protein
LDRDLDLMSAFDADRGRLDRGHDLQVLDIGQFIIVLFDDILGDVPIDETHRNTRIEIIYIVDVPVYLLLCDVDDDGPVPDIPQGRDTLAEKRRTGDQSQDENSDSQYDLYQRQGPDTIPFFQPHASPFAFQVDGLSVFTEIVADLQAVRQAIFQSKPDQIEFKNE